MPTAPIPRTPEPEVMSAREDDAYAAADFAAVNRRCARRALRVLPRAAGRALDLGTGPGDIAIEFARIAPKWRVTAVDLSADMVREAKQRVAEAGLSRRVRVVRDDAKRLRAARGPFDLVFSNSLLHHLDDPVPFWREVKRLVRPGGGVMVQDLTRPPTKRAARELERLHAADASPLLRQLFYQSLLAAYTPGEIRAQLRAAGLAGLEVRRINDRHVAVRGIPRD